MNQSNGTGTGCTGALALAGAVTSTLLYYTASDGVRFLVKTILSGGRNLIVGT